MIDTVVAELGGGVGGMAPSKIVRGSYAFPSTWFMLKINTV